MPPIHCHVPITVRIHGTPDDAQLDEMAARVRSAVGARLAQAERSVADYRIGLQRRNDEAARAATERAAVRRAVTPAEAHIPGRGWRILRAVTVRLPLGVFMEFWELAVGRPVPSRALWGDFENQTVRVTVWLVQTEVTVRIAELINTVAQRAYQLLGLPRTREVLYLLHPRDDVRRWLGELDRSGAVARIPSLTRRNRLRVSGAGEDAQLLRGGWALWASVVLPDIDPQSWLDTGPLVQATLRLDSVADAVSTESFEQDLGMPWPDYLAARGSMTVRVDLIAFRTRTDVNPGAFQHLTRSAYAAASGTLADGFYLSGGIFDSAAPGVPRIAVTHGVQYAQSLPPLPEQDAESAHSAPDRIGRGRVVVLVAVHLPADVETLTAVREAPRARAAALELRAMLERDLSDWDAMVAFYRWLGGFAAPSQRPPGGSLFEHVLAQLTATELNRLFTGAADTRWEAVERRLLLLCMATRYSSAPQVRALLSRLTALSSSRARHTFLESGPGRPGGIDLYQDPRRAVRIGARDVLGDAESLYILTKEQTYLKPEALPRLRDAVAAARIELLGEIARGEMGLELSLDDFGRMALARGVAAAGISDDDFMTRDVERSIRIVGVVRRDVQYMPSWQVQFRFVERIEGESEWSDVSDVITESSDEFTARLIYWALGRAGEVYTGALIAITVIGGIAVAIEAGLVTLLIQLAGGTGVVLASIAVSELIYLIRVIFTDEELTIEGFLMAAVEGYLGAITFRGASFVAAPLGRWIGAATVRRAWTGIVVEKLALGVIGGGSGSALTLFAQDLVNVAIGRGGFHSPAEYLRVVTIGATIGVLGEFTLAPVLTRLGGAGASATDRIASLAAQLREEGFRLADLVVATTAGLSRLRQQLAGFLAQEAQQGFYTAFRTRAGEIIDAWGTSTVARRVLELSGAQFTRQAQSGLRLFLEAADQPANQEAARRLAAEFASHPQQAVYLLEVLGTLDAQAARSLVRDTFAEPAELARFLSRMSGYSADQQRGILALLARLSDEAGVRVAPAGPGMTTAEVRRIQATSALAAEARAMRIDAADLRRQVDDQLSQALRTPEGTRRQDALLAAAAEKERAAVELERLGDELAAGRDPRPPGQRQPDLHSVTDEQLAADVDRVFAQLEAGALTSRNPWIRLPADGLSAAETDALVRVAFSSRSGNPVVFRVEGGTGADRSWDFIRIGEGGSVRIDNGGRDLNINVGSFERAVEFIIGHRPGASLKLFEVDARWLTNLRGAAVPERGLPAHLVGRDAPGAPWEPVPGTGTLTDVRGTARTVDVRQAADQLQVDGSLARELEEFIIPGTGRQVSFSPRGRTGRAPQ